MLLRQFLKEQEQYLQRLNYPVGNDLPFLSLDERVDQLIRFASHMTSEIHETLRELPTKEWKDYGDKVNWFIKHMPAARSEAVDIFCQLLNLFIYLGMSAEDIETIYHRNRRAVLADTSRAPLKKKD